jgi:acetyltransferase
MLERVKAAHPEARHNGFIVQRMLRRPGAVALLVGLVEDAVFGPLVVFKEAPPSRSCAIPLSSCRR